jgi:hypothetical protein
MFPHGSARGKARLRAGPGRVPVGLRPSRCGVGGGIALRSGAVVRRGGFPGRPFFRPKRDRDHGALTRSEEGAGKRGCTGPPRGRGSLLLVARISTQNAVDRVAGEDASSRDRLTGRILADSGAGLLRDGAKARSSACTRSFRAPRDRLRHPDLRRAWDHARRLVRGERLTFIPARTDIRAGRPEDRGRDRRDLSGAVQPHGVRLGAAAVSGGRLIVAIHRMMAELFDEGDGRGLRAGRTDICRAACPGPVPRDGCARGDPFRLFTATPTACSSSPATAAHQGGLIGPVRFRGEARRRSGGEAV